MVGELYWQFVELYIETKDPIFSCYEMGLCQLKDNLEFDDLSDMERQKLLYRSMEFLGPYKAMEAQRAYLMAEKIKNSEDKVIDFLFHQLDMARLDANSQWRANNANQAANTLLNYYARQGNTSADRVNFILPVKEVKEAKKTTRKTTKKE